MQRPVCLEDIRVLFNTTRAVNGPSHWDLNPLCFKDRQTLLKDKVGISSKRLEKF